MADYPCSSDCLASSGLEPLPNCSYPSFGAWSSFCAENEGNFSVFRTAISNPFDVRCPDLVDRQPCFVNSTGGSCSSQYTVVNATGTVGCSYNQSTCLCSAFAVTFDTYSWCSTNASSADLNLFYASTTPHVGSQIIQTGSGPCPSQCNPVNTTCYTQPSPSLASPSPLATPTPSSPCSYTAYGPPSLICYQNSSGDFHQILTRGVSPYSSACSDTVAYQPCNTTSCELWTDTTISYTCQYLNGFCNGSVSTQTNTHRCAILNTANYSAFIEQVPGTVFSTIVTTNLSCAPSCPLTNFSGTPSPIPAPAGPCGYTGWSVWSESCDEFDTGVYRQFSSRAENSGQPLICTDLVRYQSCNITNCTQQNVTTVQPTCHYDPVTALCASSDTLTTTVTICITNATSLNTYILAEAWPTLQYTTYNIRPCLVDCAPSHGHPIPAPPPPPCIYTAWSSWSYQCFQGRTPIVGPPLYYQVRNQSAIFPRPECVALAPFQRRSCINAAPDCQMFQTTNVTNVCNYNTSTNCVSTTILTTNLGYCVTDADDLAVYKSAVHPWNEGTLVEHVIPCIEACPPTDPNATVIIPFVVTFYNLSAPLVCVPPQYMVDSACVNCTNTSICTKGLLDPQLGTCTQVAACNDYNLCTQDVCDPITGACTYIPSISNQFNSSILYTCDPSNGHISWAPSTGGIIPLTGCDDGDNTTIDGYDEGTQQCTHTRLLVDNSTQLNISNCVAVDYTLDARQNTETTIIVNGSYVCYRFDEYCVGGSCEIIAKPAPGLCYYTAPQANINTSAIEYVQITQNSLCNLTIDDRTIALCLPLLCRDSKSGCAQCGSFTHQGQLDIASNCACCDLLNHGNNDCSPGFVCTLDGQCVRP